MHQGSRGKLNTISDTILNLFLEILTSVQKRNTFSLPFYLLPKSTGLKPISLASPNFNPAGEGTYQSPIFFLGYQVLLYRRTPLTSFANHYLSLA